MSSNIRRHTPGLLLSAWALGLSGLVLFAWRVHLHRHEFEWCEYPTALGDTDYYEVPFTENDFYQPGLKFPQAPDGVYRQSMQPIAKADHRMQQLGRDLTGRHVVYVESARPDSGKFYLKVAEDRYLAFGERTQWPEFRPMQNGDPLRPLQP